ncbi:MAG: GTP-binding protein [Erysipelotrichia bacterium]|nr:zinc ribbon domain-containing protein [Candidatus Riflebacteria bacterium]NCB37676.1 GTP-binding protein [Erysipelotrichia bacterium]
MASNWKCLKCENTNFETGELRATGGFLSKLFDIQTEKYTSVTCKNCGFTEFYKRSSSIVGHVVDFMIGK